jgi:hypothetical protein
MKQFVLVALFGAASAVHDAPHFFNEPTWNERNPSAAGLVQTACMSAGVEGVSCDNLLQFAEGMKGDEDLGQDITMKGQPFHYAQWNPVKVATVGALPTCHGTNGPEGVNCAKAVCDGTNGPKDGESGTPCTLEEPAAIPAYNTEPTAGQPYHTTGNLTPTIPGGHDPVPAAKAALQIDGDWSANSQPEKVSVIETKIAKQRTSFYNKI